MHEHEWTIPEPSPAICILGIDPGVTGGIAFYCPCAPAVITAEDIPVAAGEVDVDTLVNRLRQMRPTVAIIERASSRPGQGVASVFKFGAAYGALRASVAAAGIPMHLVAPTVWKRHWKITGTGPQAKEQARALAIRLWPGVGCFARKKDHGRSEAALIARYGVDVVLRATTETIGEQGTQCDMPSSPPR